MTARRARQLTARRLRVAAVLGLSKRLQRTISARRGTETQQQWLTDKRKTTIKKAAAKYIDRFAVCPLPPFA